MSLLSYFRHRLSEGSATDSTIEDAVFAAIISMCFKRILCRLRLIPNNRKANRQPITLLLQKAMASHSHAIKTFHTFTERACSVIKLTDSWKKHEMPHELGALVRSIHHLSTINGLQDVVESTSNNEMDPSSKKSLLNGIRKVARYFEVARFLCNIAKKHPSIQQMAVILVKPPSNAFEETPAALCSSTFPSMIARIGSLHDRQWNVNQICHIIGTDEIEAENRYIKQTKKTLSEAKIHAEIQLILYCEINNITLPPRVICASKDACFLCNAFIHTHGRFHTPRCHGRLYPGWRLPPFLESTEITNRFILTLENQIKNSIEAMFSKQRNTAYSYPNESTLLNLPMSASTVSVRNSHEEALHSEDGP